MDRYVVITYMNGHFVDIPFDNLRDAQTEHNDDLMRGHPSCIYDRNGDGEIVAQHEGKE